MFNHELDSESESILKRCIDYYTLHLRCGETDTELPDFYKSQSFKHLVKESFIEVSNNQRGQPRSFLITQKGKTYFEMKEKHYENLTNQHSQSTIINNITANNNSPVNMNYGSGTATQNIDYANTELINERSSLAEGTEDVAQNSKQTLLKKILNGLGSLLRKAFSFVVTHWEQLKSMVGL